MGAKSWVDLRYLDDFDDVEFLRRIGTNRITFVTLLTTRVLLEVLECVASAEDTSRHQERAIRNAMAMLR